jgi:hypothetical protein
MTIDPTRKEIEERHRRVRGEACPGAHECKREPDAVDDHASDDPAAQRAHDSVV